MAKNKHRVDVPKLVGTLLPSITIIGLKLGLTYLGFKRRSNKAGKTFKKELIKQGIDKEQADELTKMYLSTSHIARYIPSFSKNIGARRW